MCIRFGLFFFNATATTDIYTLSLHDALPICAPDPGRRGDGRAARRPRRRSRVDRPERGARRRLERDEDAHRSEEHTSELQSRVDLVCRLLLEKKKKYENTESTDTYRNAKMTY